MGSGAGSSTDGSHAQCPINGNCRNTPVEVFETRYPLVVEHYRLAEDSGGHGRTRGGYGTERVFRVESQALTVSSFMDRHSSRPWGIFGGEAGRSGDLRILRHGDTEWRTFSEVFGTVSPNKFADVQVQRGDRIAIRSPGGGGYGAPFERDPARVLEDILEGLCSRETARNVYRVAIESSDAGPQIDANATRQLRSTLRSESDVPSPNAMSGWQALEVALYETGAVHCVFCGKLIVGRAWVVDLDAASLSYCDPECERWYRDYWLPRYGRRTSQRETQQGEAALSSVDTSTSASNNE